MYSVRALQCTCSCLDQRLVRFLFNSDNGPEHGTPGETNGLRGRKRDLTEGGIRVPGLLEWPDRIKAHREISTPVVSSDLMPTFLKLVGGQMPDQVCASSVPVYWLYNQPTVSGTLLPWEA